MIFILRKSDKALSLIVKLVSLNTSNDIIKEYIMEFEKKAYRAILEDSFLFKVPILIFALLALGLLNISFGVGVITLLYSGVYGLIILPYSSCSFCPWKFPVLRNFFTIPSSKE